MRKVQSLRYRILLRVNTQQKQSYDGNCVVRYHKYFENAALLTFNINGLIV